MYVPNKDVKVDEAKTGGTAGKQTNPPSQMATPLSVIHRSSRHKINKDITE